MRPGVFATCRTSCLLYSPVQRVSQTELPIRPDDEDLT